LGKRFAAREKKALVVTLLIIILGLAVIAVLLFGKANNPSIFSLLITTRGLVIFPLLFAFVSAHANTDTQPEYQHTFHPCTSPFCL
jgi:hypothetical protein